MFRFTGFNIRFGAYYAEFCAPSPLTMVASNSLRPQPDRRLAAPQPPESQQRRLMWVALTLLMVTLVFVLYHDRDFWFPDTIEADNQPIQGAAPSPTATPATQQPRLTPTHKKSQARSLPVNNSAPVADTPVPPTTITRTVLPPLEIEVVAGSAHRLVRPGTNSVRVDLQPTDSSSQDAPETNAQPAYDTAASITSNAAEQTQMSADTTAVVERSVQPGYPMLARQMKVQGSVILQALISRDGNIQDLHVISGPPILATAAREAVKQWHFKPHYEGSQAVETQAKITVNFTISTN